MKTHIPDRFTTEIYEGPDGRQQTCRSALRTPAETQRLQALCDTLSRPRKSRRPYGVRTGTEPRP